MEKVIKTKLTNEEIINIAFDAIEGCYGIVGVCQKGVNKINILTKTQAKTGITVFPTGTNGAFKVEVYLVLSKDVKISETIRECQKVLRYTLNKKSNKLCNKVDIYVLGVK